MQVGFVRQLAGGGGGLPAHLLQQTPVLYIMHGTCHKEKATTFLESIDTNILLKMNDSELRRLTRQLDRLEQVIADLRENL